MDFIVPLLGRFHPILVHLPIGFLVFGVLMVFLSREKDSGYSKSIQLAFFVGSISAVLASISGFLQYRYEGFSWETVQFHLALGALTTVAGLYLTWDFGKTINWKSFRWKAFSMLVLLLFTGHLGGNITHGEEYLTEILPDGLRRLLGDTPGDEQGLSLPESGWEELKYYENVVQPILNSNCKSCHNPRNKKGELDLSTLEGLKKGGENGVVFHANDAEKSELFSRLVLPAEDDDHMPPKEKRQPQKEEIELIKLWLDAGASFEGTLGEARPAAKLLDPFFEKLEVPFYPQTELAEVSADSIAVLKKMGFFVEPVHLGSAMLKVSCLNFRDFQNADLSKLSLLGGNLAYLDLNDTQISGEILSQIAAFPNLTVLKLNGTLIEGKDLPPLQQSLNLKHLYLNGTLINPEDLVALESLPALEKVYAYDTPLSGNPAVKKFRFSLETGGYSLPPIPTDTIVY